MAKISFFTPRCENWKEHDHCYEWSVEGDKGWGKENFGCFEVFFTFDVIGHGGCHGKGYRDEETCYDWTCLQCAT